MAADRTRPGRAAERACWARGGCDERWREAHRPRRAGPGALGSNHGPCQQNMGWCMNPEDESPDPERSEPRTDADSFDSALDVGGPDDGAIDNPNSDT